MLKITKQSNNFRNLNKNLINIQFEISVKEADEEEDEAGEDDDDEDEEEDEEEEDIDELLTSYEKNDPKETAKNKHNNLTKQARRMPDKQDRSKRVKANIDPMDPSAYSDTPQFVNIC